MGLLLGLALAGAAWFALWRTRLIGRAQLQLAAAALLLGLAGYALQGRTGLPGSPAAQRVRPPLPAVMPIDTAAMFYGQFNAATPWLVMANSYAARGDAVGAVGIVSSALKAQPRSSELWIALGNAIVIQNDGRSTPASDLAYDRAAVAAPDHPAPPFFRGMMLLQQNQLDAGLVQWRVALVKTPRRASWRVGLAERIAKLEELRNEPGAATQKPSR